MGALVIMLDTTEGGLQNAALTILTHSPVVGLQMTDLFSPPLCVWMFV